MIKGNYFTGKGWLYSMGRLFGTDGVRGIANNGLLPELAFKLGRVAASIFSRKTGRTTIVLGKDTRISSDMLEAAIIAGITCSGGDVLRVGIIPTPGVAYLTKELSADAGVMISASHNPVEYNGIKFFSSEGYKLPDGVEDEIERLVMLEQDNLPRPIGERIGSVKNITNAEELYCEHLKATCPVDFRGLKVVVDCANGAAYKVAPKVLKNLGTELIVINHEPNGINVNLECGSTYPNAIKSATIRYGADIGLSYDGDADRLIVVDEEGGILNGDKILAVCGLDMAERGILPGKAIVATAYSNLGLTKAFEDIGGQVLIADNGDRYVLEMMREKGLILGGEQSGHIIFLDHTTTGDGVLTSLQLLSVVKRKKLPLSELASAMVEFPQILVNVPAEDKKGILKKERVNFEIQKAAEALQGRGRLHIRPSGTEPLIRIMGEGPNKEEVQEIVDKLVEAIKEES